MIIDKEDIEGTKSTEGNPGDNPGENNTGDYFLGSWKTKEDAEEGLKNLQGKLSEQGNETGMLRKQVEESQMLLSELQAKIEAGEKASKQETSSVEEDSIRKEQEKIDKKIEELDPIEEGYTSKLIALIRKSNSLAAEMQHARTLAAATEKFKSELDERDIRSAHQLFEKENPDFKTPEMQAKIREYIANDKTGMSDALVAYREIQRDEAARKARELAEQNEELMKRLNLKKGTDETGTVILKSQGTQGQTKQPKTTGAARNAGMQAVLDRMRAA